MAMWTGDCYFTTFIDTYSHHVVVRLMKSRGETLKYTQEYLNCAEIITVSRTKHVWYSEHGTYY